MTNDTDFIISELFERAKKDDSWESDEAMRIKLADGFLRSLLNSLS